MTRVIGDPSTFAQLSNLTEAAVLCDTSGRVVGQITPALEQSQSDLREPQISEEELQRREQSSEKRYTTEEVLAYLENL